MRRFLIRKLGRVTAGAVLEALFDGQRGIAVAVGVAVWAGVFTGGGRTWEVEVGGGVLVGVGASRRGRPK